MQSKGDKHSSLMFCTNGVLLRKLVGSGGRSLVLDHGTAPNGNIIEESTTIQATHIIVVRLWAFHCFHLFLPPLFYPCWFLHGCRNDMFLINLIICLTSHVHMDSYSCLFLCYASYHVVCWLWLFTGWDPWAWSECRLSVSGLEVSMSIVLGIVMYTALLLCCRS